MDYVENTISFELIEKLFDYKVFLWDPQDLVDEIKTFVVGYMWQEWAEQVQKAYEFANMAHTWQKRLSGEDYIIHPILATKMLLTLRPDIESIQACFLHDVIEDTVYTHKDIVKEFWEEVGSLCEWVSKVSHIRYTSNEKKVETLKKTFLAMAKDLRVIFLKLADRIHNIQTLHYHPSPEKRRRIAIETMKVYVPLAKKLWLFTFALYLENGSFKILEPRLFREVITYFKKRYHNTPKFIQEWTETLSTLLRENNIPYIAIKARLKSPYRIYEKLSKKYSVLDYTKVLDVLAFRVITDSIWNCYNILGLIHSLWRPIIHKIKDYIAVPKFNNYQSLHTTVLGIFEFPIEVQIRTEKMDEVAEYWVAAHFGYVENSWSTTVSDKQTKWIKELQKIVDSYSTAQKRELSQWFKEDLNIEFLNRSVFVYTPQWDVIEMAQGSTVLDFAFRVHSDVGLRFKNAMVNGAIKPINFKPKTWDVISINTFKNKPSATRYRLEFLKTAWARSKLQRYIKQKHKEQYVSAWKDILKEKLEYYWLPYLGTEKDMLSKALWHKKLEQRLIWLAEGQESATTLLKVAYAEDIHSFYTKQKTHQKDQIKKQLKKKATDTSHAIIDVDKVLDYTVCPVCHPQVWQKIIARTWKDGIKIHTISCDALQTISFGKLLEAHWDGESTNVYAIKITCETHDESWNLIHVISTLNELHIDINAVTIKKKENNTFLISITSIYANPTKASNIMSYIQEHPHAQMFLVEKSIE